MPKSRNRKNHAKKVRHNRLMLGHLRNSEIKKQREDHQKLIDEINASQAERRRDTQKQLLKKDAEIRLSEEEQVEEKVMLLKDVVPTKYSQLFVDSKAMEYADVVVDTQIDNANTIWPESQKSVEKIWVLSNGKSVGMNVRGDKATFPITTKDVVTNA